LPPSRRWALKSAHLDGELCGIGDHGLPSFSQTQAATDASRRLRLAYYVFDLLHLGGGDTASLPLIERKALLISRRSELPRPRGSVMRIPS
jgi:bifunctional non-homologous end joining protein LigD